MTVPDTPPALQECSPLERIRAENRLRAQHHVLCVLADSRTLGDAAPKVLQSVCELGEWESGVIWLGDAESQAMTCVGLWDGPGADPAHAAATRGRRVAHGEGLAGRVWASGRPDAARESGGREALCVPVRRGPEIIGVLEFAYRQERAADGEFLRLVEVVGSQVGQFVQRKRTEEELIASHRENNRLLAAIASLLISFDRDHRITRWNETAAAVFGLPERDVLGLRIEECPLHWGREEDRERFVRCCRNEALSKLEDLKFLTATGEERILSLTNYPITENDEACGCVVLGMDVTERRALEEELRRAHKLESIGQLAAGIAHEINTPIQYIGDNTNFLGETFRDLKRVLDAYRGAGGDPSALAAARATAAEVDVDYLLEEAPRALEQTLEGVKHVSRIVKAMKEFAHPGTVEKSPIDLNKALETVITVARNEWKYVARVATHLDPTLPPVRGLPGELNQVFLNLLVNAAHAVTPADGPAGAKGAITITTRNLGSVAEVRIADNGRGIPEGIRGRVFDPFFTTKPVGQGTGQGLAIAHAVVVKQHGGSISFESETGQGTTFIVQLPTDGTRIGPPERLGPVGAASALTPAGGAT